MMTIKHLRRSAWEPIDAAFLTFFRIAFGLIMTWEMWRYFNHGWIAHYWIQPEFNFTYLGFGWVRPWPGIGMYIHCAVLAMLALCIMLGIQYRLSAFLFWLGFTYLFLLEQAQYLNHFYLISLISFLLIWLPAERASSVDVYLNPTLKQRLVPRWTLWLLRFQIGLVYFYGGIAKLNHDWLNGYPMRLWLAAKTDFPLVGQFFDTEWMAYLFSYGGLFLDLLIVPFLLWKRTRMLAFAAVVLFHLMNNQLFIIGIFPFMMIAATTVFFEPDWPLRLFGVESTIDEPQMVAKGNRPRPGLRRLGQLGLALFIMWQVLMPFRHLLYSSHVHWSEEGHRFAWHMKLRDKEGHAQFFVHTNDTTTPIELRDYLSSRQIDKMATRPDMLLQFAHHLADTWPNADSAEIEVKATVFVSLNGRPVQLFVDPNVNLAAHPRSIRPKSWLMPFSLAESPLPD